MHGEYKGRKVQIISAVKIYRAMLARPFLKATDIKQLVKAYYT